MALITFPQSISVTRSTWGIKSNAVSFTSPLNGSVQTLARAGSRWKATLEYPPMTLGTGVVMETFLAQMDGLAGRCYVTPHHRPGYGAAAAVNGAGQTGTTLSITCAPNRAFAAGDYFSVNGELKVITAASVANGSGVAAIQFAPMLRASPSNAAVVTFTNPTVQMMLSTDEFSMTRSPGAIYEPFSLSLVEVFS